VIDVAPIVATLARNQGPTRPPTSER
jgi:hypothetical protein